MLINRVIWLSAVLLVKCQCSYPTQDVFFYVSGLIRDWSEKYPERGEVLLMNFGQKSFLSENMMRIIPKSIAVLNVNPEQCHKLANLKIEFFVITTDILNEVR